MKRDMIHFGGMFGDISHLKIWGNMKVNVKDNVKVNVKESSFDPRHVTKLDRKWNMKWYILKEIECVSVCGNTGEAT